MIRAPIFALFFSAVAGGLAIFLLAEGDATVLARSFERPAEAETSAALPAVSAGPGADASASIDVALRSSGEVNIDHYVARPRLTAAQAVARYAIEDESDEAIARILDFFDGRHTGLSQSELDRAARIIVEEARAQALEIELVLAVIRIESGGYNFAVSHVGAMGLMQIMPKTGEWLAAREGIAWRGTDCLFDPEVNIRLGVRYLRELAARYDDDIPTALAAYNWGPGRIDGFIRRGSVVPVRYSTKVMAAYDDQLAKPQPVASPRPF